MELLGYVLMVGCPLGLLAVVIYKVVSACKAVKDSAGMAGLGS